MDKEETLNKVLDGLIATEDKALASARKKQLLFLLGVTQVCWWGGGALSWYLSKRHYKKLYADLADQEIAEAKEFYSKFYKREGFETPEDAVSTLSTTGEKAVKALTSYNTGLQDGVVVEETRVEIEEKNIFVEREANDDWDQDQENAYRDSLPSGDPFILSQEEYMDNEFDYQQPTLTYFAEDDVLVDDKDKPIDEIDSTVGEGNLTRFGHGSKDNRILYIRNNKLSMDFEVVKNEGSYARDVLGFQHSDGPGVRKFRGVDE